MGWSTRKNGSAARSTPAAATSGGFGPSPPTTIHATGSAARCASRTNPTAIVSAPAPESSLSRPPISARSKPATRSARC
jgi:hypothetical protein